MAIRYSMIEQNTADLPDGVGAQTYNRGVNAPGGAVESILLHITSVNAAQPAATDFWSLLSQLRIVINGETIHDQRFIGASSASTQPSRAGYFYNYIGGRAAQTVDDPLASDAWLEIPIGMVLPAGVNRFEFTTAFVTAAAAIASGRVEWWIKYNTNLSASTLVAPSTSQTHAIALEQVVVRIPNTAGGVTNSVFIQNDSDADELGNQGIRANAVSDYGFTESFMRFQTDELRNGIIFGDEGASTTAAQFAVERLGANIMPLYNLAGGDVYLQVDSTAATTRTYSPVIRIPVGGGPIDTTSQTEAVPADPSAPLLRAVSN